jgi:hypothetical protein
LRVCGDYKVWAAMALQGKIAYVAEPLNYFRSHGENVRTRTEEDGLGLCEYYYAMVTAAEGVAPAESRAEKALVDEILTCRPSAVGARERIERSKRALSYLECWNERHNQSVAQAVRQRYFENLKCMLIFKEFALSAPSRWRFFLHRLRFYRYSFPEMNWRLRVVNLLRVLGAPIVGYRKRHWPEEIYGRVMGMLRPS